MSVRAARACLVAAAICGLLALYVAQAGGIDTRLWGLALRSRTWERPAGLGILLALASLTAAWRHPAAFAAMIVRAAPVGSVCWAAAAGLLFGTHAAGGADSYGYVSQALLLAEGRLLLPNAIEPAFTWPDAAATLTPLGYTRGPGPEVLAPVYPPGLPLLMAPLALIHPDAVFLLVPVCAAAAVWCAWRLGRHIAGPAAGAASAVLLSASPVFLFQSVQPMSDVPVTAFWMAALLAALHATAWGAPLAGGLASIAILIRPNLAPLLLFVVAAAGLGRTGLRVRRALACAAAALPGLALLAAIQEVRYGSALASGYGSFRDLFSPGHVGPNLARYPRWLAATHTPFIWSWLAAPIWFARRSAAAWIAYVFSVAVVLAYLPYVYFRPEEWTYARFLLPALPLMIVLMLGLAQRLLARLAPRAASAAFALLVAGLAASWLTTAARLGVFTARLQERKYPEAGALVRARVPEHGLVLAMQHSGSVRHYTGRRTLRWDLLDPAWLDRAVASLRAAGFGTFAVLDPDEDVQFRDRFGRAGQSAPARMVPVGAAGRTRIYELR